MLATDGSCCVVTVVVEQTRQTALHMAARKNAMDTALLLLKAGAALDVKDYVRSAADGFKLCYDSAAG